MRRSEKSTSTPISAEQDDCDQAGREFRSITEGTWALAVPSEAMFAAHTGYRNAREAASRNTARGEKLANADL
jgi:hypothetical protein